MRITDILKRGIHRLRVAGVPLPVLDAEVLLAHCLAVPRSYLYAHPYEEITTLQERCYDVLLVRRERHEPVAYLIGEKEFWSRAFTVDRRVLIPRPETEVLVEEALMRVQEFGCSHIRILDVGTGSGAIGITMAAELPLASVVATDISPHALQVAAYNAQRWGLQERVSFLCTRGLMAVIGTFHLILSNPPYIPESALDSLPRGVKDYEPREALNGGHGVSISTGSLLLRGVISSLVEDGS